MAQSRRLQGIAALLALLLPVVAGAQPAPPAPRGIMPRQSEMMPPMMGDAPGADMPGADPLQILANAGEVQRDLGLTERQIVNLQLASRNFLTQMQELMAPRPGVDRAQMRAQIEDQIAKTRPMIGRELTPQQLGRLRQIMLQIEGPCAALKNPEDAAQLGLNGQQLAGVGAACQDRSMQMRAAFAPPMPGEDPCQGAARNRERLTRIRSEGDRRVLALFTPEQQAQFVRMEGLTLDLPPPMPPQCAGPGRPG